MKIKVFKSIRALIIVVILGVMIIGGGVYAATTIIGSNVTYSNTKSGLKSTNVQEAIDELYETAKSHCPDGHICSLLKMVKDKNSNIVKAYIYDEKNSGTKCITGNESTCKETTCINYANQNYCKAGTIIKYKVNSSTTKTFHVMFDEGKKMTMISQQNISSGSWNNTSDYTKGPITILTILEEKTKDWNNVNSQTYTLGKTSLSGEGSYTGCSASSNCTVNSYTLPERTARARLITVQEAMALGCTDSSNSCPNWFIADDNNSYWTSSVYTPVSSHVYYVNHGEFLNVYHTVLNNDLAVRAVVEVSK